MASLRIRSLRALALSLSLSSVALAGPSLLLLPTEVSDRLEEQVRSGAERRLRALVGELAPEVRLLDAGPSGGGYTSAWDRGRRGKVVDAQGRDDRTARSPVILAGREAGADFVLASRLTAFEGRGFGGELRLYRVEDAAVVDEERVVGLDLERFHQAFEAPMRRALGRLEGLRASPGEQGSSGWLFTSDALEPRQAELLAAEYYDNQGTWAGQYRIEAIEASRLELVARGHYRLHARYLYQCQVARCGSSESRGYDERTFEVKRDSEGAWRIEAMGEYQSAVLVLDEPDRALR